MGRFCAEIYVCPLPGFVRWSSVVLSSLIGLEDFSHMSFLLLHFLSNWTGMREYLFDWGWWEVDCRYQFVCLVPLHNPMSIHLSFIEIKSVSKQGRFPSLSTLMGTRLKNIRYWDWSFGLCRRCHQYTYAISWCLLGYKCQIFEHFPYKLVLATAGYTSYPYGTVAPSFTW